MKSSSGSLSWTARIASAHIGPATVDPKASPMVRPPTVWPFSVIGCPLELAPAIIEAVARLGV